MRGRLGLEERLSGGGGCGRLALDERDRDQELGDVDHAAPYTRHGVVIAGDLARDRRRLAEEDEVDARVGAEPPVSEVVACEHAVAPDDEVHRLQLVGAIGLERALDDSRAVHLVPGEQNAADLELAGLVLVHEAGKVERGRGDGGGGRGLHLVFLPVFCPLGFESSTGDKPGDSYVC